MADTGLRRVVPSDLYPLVLGFLRDNQLSEVASKFAKATGAVSPGFGPRTGLGRLSKNVGLDMLRSQGGKVWGLSVRCLRSLSADRSKA